MRNKTPGLTPPPPLSRKVANPNMEKKKGCIINIASIHAHRSGRGAAVYAASKAGVVGFSRALAAELAGRRVRVNSISPGYVDTDMLACKYNAGGGGGGCILWLRRADGWMGVAFGEEERSMWRERTPVGRLARPEEIAEAAVFIATSGFVNGVDLKMDGGLSAV